jgi:hypothetical protein
MGRSNNSGYYPVKRMISNPAYRAAYTEYLNAQTAYTTACANARAGANNWSEVNVANRRVNSAQAKLNGISQYIEIEE